MSKSGGSPEFSSRWTIPAAHSHTEMNMAISWVNLGVKYTEMNMAISWVNLGVKYTEMNMAISWVNLE